MIKSNSNQRYATSGLSGFLLEELARTQNVPVQKFVVRNDAMCGSTIGPILATSCGIRTVDVGVPQLSMHSIREMCGVGQKDTQQHTQERGEIDGMRPAGARFAASCFSLAVPPCVRVSLSSLILLCLCGCSRVADVHSSFRLLSAFYTEFAALDKKLIVKGE